MSSCKNPRLLALMAIIVTIFVYLICKPKRLTSIQDSLNNGSIPNSRIAIFTVLQRETDENKYKEALMTWRCYAKTYGYFFRILTLKDSIEHGCNQKAVYFWRHCLYAKYLERNQDLLDYALMFDADMGVINPRHSIQEWITDPDPNIEMHFYVRHFALEIAAGSYIVKNTEFARHFLTYLADCNYRQPDPRNSNDNGMLHQVFMELCFDNPVKRFACFDLLKNQRNNDPDYFNFTACTWGSMGYNNSRIIDGKIMIHHKITGKPSWVRDMWLTEHKVANRDFIMHPLKSSWRNNQWKWIFKRQTFDDSLCINDGKFLNWEYEDEYFVSDDEVFSYLKNNSQMVERKHLAIFEKWNITGKQ